MWKTGEKGAETSIKSNLQWYYFVHEFGNFINKHSRTVSPTVPSLPSNYEILPDTTELVSEPPLPLRNVKNEYRFQKGPVDNSNAPTWSSGKSGPPNESHSPQARPAAPENARTWNI
jgi:hypothetical protein